MLSNFQLSSAIVGDITIQIVTFVILRLIRGSKKPKGSISEDITVSPEVDRVPGKLIVWLIALGGSIIYFVIFFKLIGHCLSNSWESSNLYKKAIQFPIWVNFVGISILWFCGLLKSFVMAFNVNYTLFFFPMKHGYTLATGGQYKFIRHPGYLMQILWALALFLMTGIQLLLISLFCYLFYIIQAYYEEKTLKRIFGDYYVNYVSKTGMFLPRFFKH